MNISRNKILSVLALFLLISTSASLSSVLAHDPGITIPTWTYVTVAPNPIGVNQQTTFVIWNTIAPPDAASSSAIRWSFTVSVTDSDNVTQSLGTFTSDESGRALVTYTPTKVGNYSVTASFPKTVYNFQNTPAQRLYYNDTFAASSYTATFAVQSSPIGAASPLPTETDWWTWTQNYYGGNSMQGTQNHKSMVYNVTGSVTSHILWVKAMESGGMVGGTDTGVVPGNAFFQGLAYNARFVTGNPTQGGGATGSGNPVIAIDGKLYYKDVEGNNVGSNQPYIVVDMRTGQQIARTSLSSYSVIGTNGRSSTYSAFGTGYVCNGVDAIIERETLQPLVTSTGVRPIAAYDPATLTLLPWNISVGAPDGDQAYGPNGEIMILIFGNTNGTSQAQATPGTWMIAQWNSSKALTPGMVGPQNLNKPQFLDFNVSITKAGSPYAFQYQPTGSAQYDVLRYVPNDYALVWNLSTRVNSGAALPANSTWKMVTISLKPENRGEVIADYTFNRAQAPFDENDGAYQYTPNIGTKGDLDYMQSVIDDQNHVLPIWSVRTLQWFGLNFMTGEIWGPTAPQTAMDFYAAPDNTAWNRDSFADHGKLFEASWGGILYVYDTANGNLLYTYGLGGRTVGENRSSAGLQTLYNGFPSFINGYTPENQVAYTCVNEHSPNAPLIKDTYVRAINVTTGEELWLQSQYGGVWSSYNGDMVNVNGYTVVLNNHDERLYCYGKGPSAVTVSTVQNATQNNNIVIQGTVMDVAPGLTSGDIPGRFPLGVPAISNDNMSIWMEYLYQHHEPRPSVTGVNVTLTLIDSSGSTTDIATVTSDSTGYFNYVYAPTTTGTFSLVAGFAGSPAYAPSSAMTTYTVSQPSATTTPTATAAPGGTTTDTYILGSTAAIIVVIAIVTVVIALLLRRRP